MVKHLPLIFVTALGSFAHADPVTLPNTLSNDTTADANQVQANFQALADESNEDDARIAEIEDNLRILPDLNTAVGVRALDSLTTGVTNTAVGADTLQNTLGGGFNTALGYGALRNNRSGGQNTAIGYDAGPTGPGGDQLLNTTAIGASAAVSESNTIQLGNIQIVAVNTFGTLNAAGLDVGTGPVSAGAVESTSVQTDALVVNGSTAVDSIDATGDITADTLTALFIDTTGPLTAGSINILTDLTADNVTASSLDVTGTIIANSVETTDLDAVFFTTNTVDATGDIFAVGVMTATAFISSSDARRKEAIEPITSGLALVNDLSPVKYHRIDNPGDDIEMGLLAQDIKEVLRTHGLSDSGMIHQPDDSDYMFVRYNDLLAPMIRAIQELDAQQKQAVSEKDHQIAALQEQLFDQQQKMLELLKTQQQQIARLEAMVKVDQVAAR